ncbi:hypothetical protein OG735_01235 [Streptomyces sp. NBC_01210]|uniref:hypothetical protein n=1 Tax=Streptomyces sp. NBC_01210 TaxID=2903774 RepID=UPI002E0E2B18|nr:hypothetical protein OG735_01235 [Streptomyces sp. NBC_01210]
MQMLGPKTSAQIPAATRQAVVVIGEAPDSSQATTVLYERGAEGWKVSSHPWPARNGGRGWTRNKRDGDQRSPIGVFGLTVAGGLLADPGTTFAYEQTEGFTVAGRDVKGELFAGAFDYAVAVDVSRKPWNGPLDGILPRSGSGGEAIWIYADDARPTRGSVSLSRGRMKELLRWLDPSSRPVVVMGDASALGR